ncbi:hypothetical protein GDO81_022311 [Engystomops pustulosus]|uniref:Uncharacterized protein n=1 Tax=Engystomops pustulosus TaxID=76066 RepID=A0AAV6YPP6_ENGPU|nr:hypothetical protein GDO81_022311 [Engystomops pustulosus]
MEARESLHLSCRVTGGNTLSLVLCQSVSLAGVIHVLELRVKTSTSAPLRGPCSTEHPIQYTSPTTPCAWTSCTTRTCRTCLGTHRVHTVLHEMP